jgi:hypothetical protein
MPVVHFFRYPEFVIDDRQSRCNAQILWRIPGMGLSLFDPFFPDADFMAHVG